MLCLTPVLLRACSDACLPAQVTLSTSKTPRRRPNSAIEQATFEPIEPHLCLFGGSNAIAGLGRNDNTLDHAVVYKSEYTVLKDSLCFCRLFCVCLCFALACVYPLKNRSLALCVTVVCLFITDSILDKYYKLGGEEEVKLFLENPNTYLQDRAIGDVAHHIPLLQVGQGPFVSLSGGLIAWFSQTRELYSFAQHSGYCPVKLAAAPTEGPVPPSCLERGKRRFLALYKGKFFAMASQSCLEQFLRTPWKFTEGKLPLKLPHAVPATEAQRTLPIGKLPTLGYLEQVRCCPAGFCPLAFAIASCVFPHRFSL